MANNSNFAAAGGAVAEEVKQMAVPDKNQIGSIESELESAEQEFRKAADSKDHAGMLQSHKRICELVAALSAAWSGGAPTVFSAYYREPGKAESGGDLLEISSLEKELAELASKMQKCLEAGDMDGMLQANERMGQLSELMAKAEQQQKERKAALSRAEAPKQEEKPGKSSGGWSAGDTLALAKQRAEERKKNQKLTDSFDIMMGGAQTGSSSAPSSTTEMLLAQPQQAGSQEKPKASLNQDQLREKLENYSFYEILSIPSTASFEELHRAFFKKIRNLNKKLAAKTLLDWQFQEFVAILCLAHDVLKHPNARLQYDLVLLGPADGGMGAEAAAKNKLVPLKDMIKFSTLVSTRELSDAVEMHRDNRDDRAIGHYLVEKGLLSSEELDSILFAQKLVTSGKLTVAQFELAMQELRENSIPLLDTLVGSEWIKPQDVFSADFA